MVNRPLSKTLKPPKVNGTLSSHLVEVSNFLLSGIIKNLGIPLFVSARRVAVCAGLASATE